MYLFLIPLLLGFIFNSASAFTAFYSRQFGERGGRLVSIVLRDVVGIPVWAIGYVTGSTGNLYQLVSTPVIISSSLGWLLILAGVAIIMRRLLSSGGGLLHPRYRIHWWSMDCMPISATRSIAA